MEDLIKALQIFLKYGNPQFPTHCEHDILYVQISPDEVSAEDLEELEKLHFSPDEYGVGFSSTYYGSC
jgi:hypothetical protein